LILLLLFSFTALASEELYWEDALDLSGAGAYYPQTITSDQGYLFVMWQEYDKGEKRKINFLGSFSEDGNIWSSPVILLPTMNYQGEDRVSLFSLSQDSQGNLIVALNDDEREIGIYKLNSSRSVLDHIASVHTDYTVVVPRLFRDKNDELLLFLTQRIVQPNGTKALSIFSAASADGFSWTNPEHFIKDLELKQNFLPYYTYDEKGEYVAFQSLYTGNRNSYQIFFKSKLNSDSSWSREKQITDFKEYRQGQDFDFFQFDNQRPHIFADNGTVHLVWERRLGREAPQIYYLTLNGAGEKIEDFEQISRGTYFTASPRIVKDKDSLHILYFDNRNGNQIILAERRGIFWKEKNISLVRGDSTYARWLSFNSDLYILWENRRNDIRRSYLLRPDKSAPPALIRTVNFNNGGRQADSRSVISWKRPKDSSGIMGFSYVWDSIPDTEPPEDMDYVDLSERTSTFLASTDGPWYFHIKTVDYAGNWSETERVSITRDTTPPDAVSFLKPLTDEKGFLVSNTFSILWDSREEFLGGFSYKLHFIGEDVDFIDPDSLNLPLPPDRVLSGDKGVQYSNRDNGVWALSVVAYDDVGNISDPKVILFRTNKYIPVSYISDIQSSRDELERVVLRLIGRGFKVGGDITTVVLDKDGQAPWDYEFSKDDFSVRSDRIIENLTVEVFDEGTYQVGVIHPQRGLVFARGKLRLDASGTVRFGDFSYNYDTFWQPVRMARTLWNLNRTLFMAIMILLIGFTFVITVLIYQIMRENSILEEDIRAILDGKSLSGQTQKETLKIMKKKGVSLRLKFTLSILTLVLLVTMTVALSLGQFMINTQKTNLSEGLYQKSALLLETLASGARTYLPTQNRLELGLLPGQISAMVDAQSTTISGIGANNPDAYNYIWASNNPDINQFQSFPSKVEEEDLVKPDALEDLRYAQILSKYRIEDSLLDFSTPLKEDRADLYLLLVESDLVKDFEAGSTEIQDELSEAIRVLETDVNEKASELIGDQNIQLDQLSEDAVRLAIKGDRTSLEDLRVIQETISRIETEINDKLKTVSNRVYTYPEFTAENINPDNLNFTFYKPIVYRNKGMNTYFRGIIRLNVSIENILNEIISTQQNIVRITIIISLLAIFAGFMGAMLLAQAMINPIKKLVKAVEIVRDTQDKSKLGSHVIELKSKDELSDLASTFNQMTQGLVKAAAANKELTLGKEIQKKFIPLETMAAGNRKLTTGELINDDAHFYGYYEGAKGVSGDYFDFRQLDDEHFAIIKCDIAGKGIPASLIMVEVATIFINYFKNINIKKDGVHIQDLVYSINDLLEEVGFEGRFAAFIVVVMNVKTGKCWLCNAGDNLVHIYNDVKRKMYIKTINEVPAAGVFPSFMLDGDKGYKQLPHMMKSGDIMFLFTDGIEEAQRHFRNNKFERIVCDDSCDQESEGHFKNHEVNSEFEEFSIPRIHDVIEATLHKQKYTLFKYHDPTPQKLLSFDFTNCSGDMDQAVMALVSVEKVFRMNADPTAGDDDRIRIDNKIDEFLKKHFDQYREYFRNPIPDEEFPEYTYYSHLKEDAQYDDLTILGIKKK